MENKSGYVATFRRCDKSKAYLSKMYHSLKDKMNFLILEMKTSETKTFRHEYITALAKEIREAENSICIISGELSSNIWNSNEIIKAISNTAAKSIKILCGPNIDIKSAEVLKLAASGKIELYFSKKRNKKHFMLTEKALFLEKGHRNFDFSNEILMTRKEAGAIISFYKIKFANKILLKKPVLAGEILQKFSPRVFERDAKENNREPTEKEIDNFKNKLGI